MPYSMMVALLYDLSIFNNAGDVGAKPGSAEPETSLLRWPPNEHRYCAGYRENDAEIAEQVGFIGRAFFRRYCWKSPPEFDEYKHLDNRGHEIDKTQQDRRRWKDRLYHLHAIRVDHRNCPKELDMSAD